MAIPTAAPAPEDEIAQVLRLVADSAWDNQDWVAARRAYELVLDRNGEEGVEGDAHALNRLGRLHLMNGELDDAIGLFHDAFAIDKSAATCINLAVAHGRLDEYERALSWCADALLIEPGYLPAYIHMAALYEEMGQLQDARDIVKRGLELHPADPQLLYTQGVHALMGGDCERGWAGYEFRSNRLDLVDKLDEYREWQGEDLTGKTILICWEQGYGDQIMWARYLPVLVELGGQVVLFTRPELARLLGHSYPAVQIVTTDLELAKIEPHYWVAMGSLPLRCGQPHSHGAYLKPLAADVDRFRALVPADGTLRVGLCWAGNPEHFRDGRRSMAWEEMRALRDVEGCTFYSLQRGGQASGLISLVDYCHDLADTAAAIECLDLVISVDTVILHLAGAIGKRVWGIVPAEWRWGNEAREGGKATPWYPSASLFARSKGIAEVAQVLAGAPFVRVIEGGDVAGNRTDVDPVLVRECRYGQMAWYRNDTYTGRSLDFYGEYSQGEADLFARLLKPGDTVIEAGANIGALTVALCDRVGTAGRVLCFEPQPIYANLLRRNVDGRNAFVYALALGADEKVITLRHVHTDKMHAPGWKSTGAEFQVEQVSIDSFFWIERLDLLKVDVDGPEHQVLMGAERTIERCRPLIYVEHDKVDQYPDMLPWLLRHNYRLYEHKVPLFNPANFAGNPVNVFGSVVSLMVLAVPQERKDIHPSEWGLQRIRQERVAA